jgi:hypothetical protein
MVKTLKKILDSEDMWQKVGLVEMANLNGRLVDLARPNVCRRLDLSEVPVLRIHIASTLPLWQANPCSSHH